MNMQATISFEVQTAKALAQIDWNVAHADFQDEGEEAFDADIGGVDGWVSDNVLQSATLEVWDKEGEIHTFDFGRDELAQVIGDDKVRDLEQDENERGFYA